jgi:hypothetical protein
MAMFTSVQRELLPRFRLHCARKPLSLPALVRLGLPLKVTTNVSQTL